MLVDVETTVRSQLAEAGSEPEFWKRVSRAGTPRIESVADGRVQVSFLYRHSSGADPARVYFDASSLTDHHSAQLTTMRRLDDTGIWFWSAEVASTWRGSYRFVPASAELVAQVDPPGIADTVAGVRSRFLGLLDHAVADEFNPRRASISGTDRASLAEMPDAPVQRWWHEADENTEAPRELVWDSTVLGNSRRVWVHETPGDTDARRPLVIVLDGERWVEDNPLAPVLDLATEAGEFPAAVVVFVHTIDNDSRGEELPCNADFWRAIIDELLPKVADITPFTDDPTRTVVAGQSYGGLAGMFAALTRPDRFALVASQSGSFWWPQMPHGDTQGPLGGRIAEMLADQVVPSFRADMTVGIHEGHMPANNERIADMLRTRGIDVRYSEFDGGHEWLCWRGDLVESLIRLLS